MVSGGLVILVFILLYRRIETIGKMSVVMGSIVILTIIWIIVSGLMHQQHPIKLWPAGHESFFSYVFWAAIERGMYGLVLLGAILTVVALYYYLLVARRMYIEAPVNNTPVRVPALLSIGIGLCAFAVIAIGLYPGPWVAMALRVAATLFA